MISSRIQAHRDATRSNKIAVPYIQDLLKAMHIPIIEVAGYEADDLIGTIAKQAEKQNYQVWVTPDKDFAQLVRNTMTCGIGFVVENLKSKDK
jgi:DNA polymerase-1